MFQCGCRFGRVLHQQLAVSQSAQQCAGTEGLQSYDHPEALIIYASMPSRLRCLSKARRYPLRSRTGLSRA
jgi:hypothetical protein